MCKFLHEFNLGFYGNNGSFDKYENKKAQIIRMLAVLFRYDTFIAVDNLILISSSKMFSQYSGVMVTLHNSLYWSLNPMIRPKVSIPAMKSFYQYVFQACPW